ncbi:MAG TPA: lysylphosphatidylglycerol synthase transmembrane domain-containing protein [Candidatus Obscuribacterales bacterium]
MPASNTAQVDKPKPTSRWSEALALAKTGSTAMQHPVLRHGLAAIFVAIVVHAVNVHKVVNTLVHASWTAIGIAELFTVAAIIVQILIWGLLVRVSDKKFNWGGIGSLYLQGLFFSHVLPGTVSGDALRLFKSAKLIGTGDAIASVVAGRTAELFGTFLVGIIAVATLPGWFDRYRWIAMCGVFVGLGVVYYLMFRATVPAESKDKAGILQPIIAKLRDGASAYYRYRSDQSVLVWCIALAALQWCLLLVSFVYFSLALATYVPWNVFAVAVPASILTAIIPISVNGLGFREGLFVWILAIAGVDPAQALGIAILIDVQLLPVVAAGGICWLLDRS